MTSDGPAAGDEQRVGRLLAVSTLTPLFSPDPARSASPFDVLINAVEVGSDGSVGAEDLLRVTAGLHGLAFVLVREVAALCKETPLTVLRRLALDVNR